MPENLNEIYPLPRTNILPELIMFTVKIVHEANITVNTPSFFLY